MSDVLTRLLVLRKVIEAGSNRLSWCGNIAMQKLVYLLEHVYKADLGYTYGLHHLGPYSHELARDLSLGEQAHLWYGKTVYASTPGNSFAGIQYKVHGDEGQPAPEQAGAEQAWTRIRPAMDALISAVANCTGRDLELLATIHYLRTVQEVPESELWAVLHALKPKYTAAEFHRGQETLAAIEHEASELTSTPNPYSGASKS